MDEKQYIGPYQVLGVSKEVAVTPTGGEIIRVTFETAPAKIMPKRTFDLLVSGTPTDATTLEDKFIETVASGLFEFLKEYDLTSVQLEQLLLQTSRVANGMFDKASHIAFTKEVFGKAQTESWQRGGSFTHYRTLNECAMIITQNEPKTENQAS